MKTQKRKFINMDGLTRSTSGNAAVDFILRKQDEQKKKVSIKKKLIDKSAEGDVQVVVEGKSDEGMDIANNPNITKLPKAEETVIASADFPKVEKKQDYTGFIILSSALIGLVLILMSAKPKQV